jgi:hypothetical protein
VTLHFSCPASQELFRPPWPAPTKISLQQPNKKKLKGNLKDSCASPELWLSRAGRKKKGGGVKRGVICKNQGKKLFDWEEIICR